MDIIKYGFSEIDAAAADIQTTASRKLYPPPAHIQPPASRIGSLLHTLKSQIQPMVTAWEGSSSTAYQEAQAKWDHSADELNTILDTIARTVRNGNDDMSDVNRAATSSWG